MTIRRLFLILTLSVSFSQVHAQTITSNNPTSEPTNEYYPSITWEKFGSSEFDHEVNSKTKYGLVHVSGERIFENEFDHIVNLKNDKQLYILFKADTFGIYSVLDSSYSGCIYTDIREDNFVYEFNFQRRKGFIYDKRDQWTVYIPPFEEAELISRYSLSVLTENGYQLILLYGEPETVVELNSEYKIEYGFNFGYHSKFSRNSVRLYVLEAGKLKWSGDFSQNVQHYDSLLIDRNSSDLSVYNYKTGALISEIKTSCDYISFDEKSLLVFAEIELNEKTEENFLFNPFTGEQILSIQLPTNTSMLSLEPKPYSTRKLDQTFVVYYIRSRNNFKRTYSIGELTGYEYTPYKKPRISIEPTPSTYSKRRFPLFWTSH